MSTPLMVMPKENGPSCPDAAAILADLLPDALHEETHLSHVFITDEDVYKLKKPLKLPFCDFSTVEKRRLACLKEIEVNQDLAQEIYYGVIALTSDNEEYAFDGKGQPIDWLVHMAPFKAEDRADLALDTGRISDRDLIDFTTRLYLQHDRIARTPVSDWPCRLLSLTDNLAGNLLGSSPSDCWREKVKNWQCLLQGQIENHSTLLEQRGLNSALDRCHGDLHLENLCLWQDRLIAYDALEFDESLIRIDRLYDTAFLIADLWHRDFRAEANLVMNRYLGLSSDYDSIRLMPLYCALRTAIRAMTAVLSERMDRANSYLTTSHSFLKPKERSALHLISGRSGTGKSTLAASLAPLIGSPPGALHLRSDIIRKRLFNCLPEEELPKSAYHEDVSRDVYSACTNVASALKNQWSVILDIAFAGETTALSPALTALEPIKIWLTAPDDVLRQRLEERKGDASDATARVMMSQRAAPPGEGWRVLDASGPPEQILSSILRTS